MPSMTTRSATRRASTEPRTLLTARSQERELLARALRAAAPASGPLRVLEAGCGQKWLIQLPGVDLRITGVDNDPDALRIRQEQQHDLDEVIVADLRSVELPGRSFDVAYCAFVLEHVEGAEHVLDRLLAAVRPGGRLIILVPNGRSVYGWAAKHFPFWAAVGYKKYIEGFKDAGKPGHAPYPTVYDPVVTLDGMRAWADARHVRIVEEYGIDYVMQRFGRFRGLVGAVMKAFVIAGGRRLTATHNNLGYVLEKSF
jgi:SAM-dependent methyltransferase